MSDQNENHFLDPSAFVGALLLAPILFALLFCWALFIPVAAVLFGGLPYLIFGGPVFLWMVTRYPPSFLTFAFGGLVAHVFFVICLALWEMADNSRTDEMLGFMALWGLPFCMGWGGTFAWLYGKFYRSPLGHLVD